MSKRWPGLLFFMVWIGGSGVAHAAVTATPDPIAIGAVAVGQPGTGTTTLSANPQVDVATFDLTAVGCSEFQVTTPTPLTGINSTGKTVTVQFTPASTGAKSCMITAKDSGGTVLGTFTATGTGAPPAIPAISVTPASDDFGSVRVANAATTTATQVFTLTNTGDTGSTLSISNITFSDLSSADYRLNPPVTFPLLVLQGTPRTVTVEFDPSAAGARTASMAIASNAPTTPTTINLTGTGTTATIAVTDVDFSTVNNGATSTQNLAVTNAETSSPGVLTVTSATITGGNGFFSFGTTQGCTGGTTCTFTQPFTVTTGTLDVPVRCQPPAAATGTQTATVTFMSDTDPSADTTAQLTCTAGRPDIMVSTTTLAFGNVLVGSTSAALTVTATNNGNATLTISSATLQTGAADYTIVTGQTGSQMIGPGASATWDIACRPSVQGDLPGTFRIASDSLNTSTTTDVTLTCTGEQGTGTGRKVAFGPSTINLGYAAVGFPITAADILVVTNQDPSVSFQIRAIELDDDSVFRIDSAPADVELPAAMTRSFSLTFEPTEQGHFETTARLFLDQDGQEQATVTISGDTTGPVSVHGGGGCSTGGASGGPSSGAAIALLTLVLCRRRRTLAVAAISLAMLGRAGSAVAEDVVIGVFAPTPATTGTGFQLESPDVGPPGSWVASGVVSHATDVLVFDTYDYAGDQVTVDRAIKQRTMFVLGGAYAFFDRFEAGLRLPVYAQDGDPRRDPRLGGAYVTPATGTALGDLTIHAKAHLARAGAATFGAAVHVTLPTATAGQFTGVDAPTAGVRGLAAWSPLARLALSATAGGVLRKTSVYRDVASISQGSGVTWGAAASYRVLDRLWATGEVFGEIIRSGRTERGMNTLALAPVEALAGATYRFGALSLGVAAGRGITDGIGAPDLRGVAMLSYTMGAPEAAPLHPHVVPAPDRDSDSDGDGIADRLDRCPRELQGKDRSQRDGCPDPDNDGDGVADARDRCALEPEDRDGFQDSDGCPDPDNDGDAITDAQDRCPDQPEAHNGKDDDDGCPDQVDASIPAPEQGSALKAAEATFARGRELLQQGKYQEACVAFEQSQRLDPQFGTQYNIAGCYEKTGKLATAWNLYRELARSDSNPTRRAKAAELAASLAARVPRIKLVLPQRPEGLQLHLNSENATALIGVETPVDFGRYTIAASASGHRAWRKTVDIREEGKVVTVVIELEPAR